MPAAVPELFDRRLQGRALAGLVLGAGTAIAVTLALPHSTRVNEPGFGLVGAAFLLSAALAWRRQASIGPTAQHASLALATLGVAAANALVGNTALYGILFTWAGLYAFYFFPVRVAARHMVLVGAGYVAALALSPVSSPLVRWLLAVGTPLAIGLAMSRLLDGVRRQAVAQQDSERRLRAIMDSAPDAFVVLDREGTVVVWNPAAERLLGFTAEQSLGRRVRDLIIRDEDRERHLERLRLDFEAPAREVEPDRREVTLRHRDGHLLPCELTVSRVAGSDRPLITTFIRDLSERERREAERAELLHEQAAREEAEQMAGIVHGLQLLLDAALAHNRLEDMLAALLPRLCEVLGAEAASILLVEEDGSTVVRASTAPSEEPVVIPAGEGVPGRVVGEGVAQLVQYPDTRNLYDPAMRQMSSVLIVPLVIAGETIGAIQVGVPAPRRFGDDDVLLVGLAADRVALALNHARIYEREHRIAEMLQRSLLPERLPSLPGLAVAARYLPAAAEAEVGGDWYDVIPIGSGQVGLVMGDVAGKGLAAASMVGRLRSAMRAYALEGHEPAEVVERLNQLVWSELDESQMATLVYVVADPEERRVRWVNAGHLPPLVIEGTATRYLESPGAVPLGVLPFPGYASHESELAPGAMVLLYTDGLVERPGEVLDAGLGRLAAAAASAAGGGPERLCDEVVRALVPAGAASDDVAVLALHDPPLSDRFDLELPSEPGELAAMRAMLRRWLNRASADEDAIADILTAAGEAAANAIEHSGAGAGAAVRVSARRVNGEIRITVSDGGSWRPQRADGGGRGLVLMRALMDGVEVTPSARGTTVQMVRRVGAAGHRPAGPARHAERPGVADLSRPTSEED